MKINLNEFEIDRDSITVRFNNGDVLNISKKDLESFLEEKGRIEYTTIDDYLEFSQTVQEDIREYIGEKVSTSLKVQSTNIQVDNFSLKEYKGNPIDRAVIEGELIVSDYPRFIGRILRFWDSGKRKETMPVKAKVNLDSRARDMMDQINTFRFQLSSDFSLLTITF